MMEKNLKYYQNLMLDSGAFSVWKSGADVNLDEYISFCLKYKDDFQVIVSLDVIPGSAKDEGRRKRDCIEKACKEGWGNYLKMLSAGLPKSKVVPVFHQLDGWEWLEKYLDFGCPYIGLSLLKKGEGRFHRQWLDQCMKYVCDSEGNPKVKLHGFGITNAAYLSRYPWYSCDSTSWKIASNFGNIFIPHRKEDGSWDFLSAQRMISFSTRKGERSRIRGACFDHLSFQMKRALNDYLDFIGVPIGESSFRKEPLTYRYNSFCENIFERHSDHFVIEEKRAKGVCNDLFVRYKANKKFFAHLQMQLLWPRKFQFFGHSIL